MQFIRRHTQSYSPTNQNLLSKSRKQPIFKVKNKGKLTTSLIRIFINNLNNNEDIKKTLQQTYTALSKMCRHRNRRRWQCTCTFLTLGHKVVLTLLFLPIYKECFSVLNIFIWFMVLELCQYLFGESQKNTIIHVQARVHERLLMCNLYDLY